MQLDNRTRFQAERFVAADRDSVEHLVVVVKGTYLIGANGSTRLADEQMPIHLADEHYGDPGVTSVRYESDCVPSKPQVDVIVIGHAHAPRGRQVRRRDVELQVGSVRKRVLVIGDRVWRGWWRFGYWKSIPQPFSKMPLVYERAFGGSDTSHRNPAKHASDLRNPFGRGFHEHRSPQGIVGSPLPNLEDPRHRVRRWRSRPAPIGFGCVPRGSANRIRHAGTYDQAWLDERFPFLPDDFDTRYYQCAPDDQQLGELRGGEPVRCIGMTPNGEWRFRVPETEDFPIHVFRREGHDTLTPRLDTLVLEPDEGRCSLVWRSSVPVGPKLHDIVRVIVGHMTPGEQRAEQSGKHYFASVAELVAWQMRVQLEAER